ECLEAVRLTNSNHGVSGESFGRYGATPFAAKIEETGYAVGSRVFHQKFGEGMVIDTEGAGDHARVQVNFKHAGLKWLVTAFAKLEKL
ncbi:MAG: DNA helicase II, partial [Thiotrichales bacterium]|nr:DNA helicase II [Thiotrichales bacterium]